jgi:Domain of unknown function (DUF4397)
MKYYLFLSLLLLTGFASCKKGASSSSALLIHNATSSISALTASWNGAVATGTALAPGATSGTPDAPYLYLPAGTNNLVLKSGTTVLVDKNIYTSSTGGYSMLLYDTGVTAGAVRILIMNDDLTLPDTASIHIRVLDCAPDTAGVDVWLVNSSNADSLRLDSAFLFMGAEAVATDVQTFTAIKYHGLSYSVKIKKTGTEEVLASVINYPFKEQGIYSVVYSGLLSGTGNAAPKLAVIHHQLK